MVVPAPTLYCFNSVLSTPTVLHFGEDFGLRPRLFASEGKVLLPAPVALLWRLAESVEGSHTPPFQPNWRRFRRATSPRGVRRGARVPPAADGGVRCPRGVNNFPLKLVFSPFVHSPPLCRISGHFWQPPPEIGDFPHFREEKQFHVRPTRQQNVHITS